jgi:hypothetical protein
MNNPQGFINPSYGRSMGLNNTQYISPEVDMTRYLTQPMEADARAFGTRYNRAIIEHLVRQRLVAAQRSESALPGIEVDLSDLEQ